MDTNSKWILGIVFVLIVVIVVFHVNLNLNSRFSILTTTRTCSNWLTNQHIISTVIPPFNWKYTSSQIRCVTSMTDMSNGCKIIYSPGQCVGTGTCQSDVDTNCDNIISDTELVIYGNKWVSGNVVRSQLATAIVAWSGV